jgi:hypothetical protein
VDDPEFSLFFKIPGLQFNEIFDITGFEFWFIKRMCLYFGLVKVTDFELGFVKLPSLQFDLFNAALARVAFSSI